MPKKVYGSLSCNWVSVPPGPPQRLNARGQIVVVLLASSINIRSLLDDLVMKSNSVPPMVPVFDDVRNHNPATNLFSDCPTTC